MGTNYAKHMYVLGYSRALAYFLFMSVHHPILMTHLSYLEVWFNFAGQSSHEVLLSCYISISVRVRAPVGHVRACVMCVRGFNQS